MKADSETVPAVQQEIIALAHEWMEAAGRRDRAALNRILADDFVIAGWLPEGRLGDKPTYIEDCLRPVEIEQPSYKYDHWTFRILGDIAIVNCTLDIHALVSGIPWGGLFLLTQVWSKRDKRWQITACHSSPVIPAEG